jgi:hypothetical protein
MYDDSTNPPLDRRPVTGSYLHLCPECRDLMAAVVEGPRSFTVAPPEPPDWERALRWLDAQCGGREAVLTLGERPLEGAPPAAPPGSSPEQVELVGEVGERLDAVGARFFTPEFALACRRALTLVLLQRPGLAVGQRPAVLAHGVTWAVGRANGALYPTGVVSDRSLRELFDSGQAGSGMGRKVQVAVRSLFDWSEPRVDDWRWPVDRAPLDPLGHPSLLVSGVRRRLIEVRERALREAALEVPA